VRSAIGAVDLANEALLLEHREIPVDGSQRDLGHALSDGFEDPVGRGVGMGSLDGLVHFAALLRFAGARLFVHSPLPAVSGCQPVHS